MAQKRIGLRGISSHNQAIKPVRRHFSALIDLSRPVGGELEALHAASLFDVKRDLRLRGVTWARSHKYCTLSLTIFPRSQYKS
jgi:hypothetical protein